MKVTLNLSEELIDYVSHFLTSALVQEGGPWLPEFKTEWDSAAEKHDFTVSGFGKQLDRMEELVEDITTKAPRTAEGKLPSAYQRLVDDLEEKIGQGRKFVKRP